VEELLDQERVGGLAEMWASGTDFGRQINTLLARILRFLEGIRNALRGQGFQTWEDVFERVAAGELAERANVRAKAEGTERKVARRVVARDEAAIEADRRQGPRAETWRDEPRRVGREQAEALKRLDERRRTETPQAPARDADEQLPDVDAMDTFDLRHLSKDLGLPDGLWRGRSATDIRKAIKAGRSAAEIRRAIKGYYRGSPLHAVGERPALAARGRGAGDGNR
jgi:hypothetical protein